MIIIREGAVQHENKGGAYLTYIQHTDKGGCVSDTLSSLFIGTRKILFFNIVMRVKTKGFFSSILNDLMMML